MLRVIRYLLFVPYVLFELVIFVLYGFGQLCHKAGERVYEFYWNLE